MDEIIGKMTESDYYKLRFYMEEMSHYNTKLKLATHNFSSMEKDIELQRLKNALYKQIIKDVEASAKQKQTSYEEIRKQLEAKYEIKCEDWAIDDYTYEIKRIIENK